MDVTICVNNIALAAVVSWFQCNIIMVQQIVVTIPASRQKRLRSEHVPSWGGGG